MVILTTSAEYLPFLQIQPQVIVPIVDGGLPFGTSIWILHLRTLPVHATVLMHGGLQRGVGFSSWSRADLLGDSQIGCVDI